MTSNQARRKKKSIKERNNGIPSEGESLVKIKTQANESKCRFGNWNSREYAAKKTEINEIFDSRKTDLAVLSETKKKGSGTMESGNYITIYSGVPKTERVSGGVMLYIYSKHRENIDSYNVCHERVISTRFHLKEGFLTIIGVYAPVEGREERSEKLYEYLKKTVQAVNPEENLVTVRDLIHR